MAIDVLRRYERLKGVNYSVSTRKAQCYMMMGDSISALKVMDSLVIAEPHNMLSYMMRAAFYQEAANLDSAICDYRRLKGPLASLDQLRLLSAFTAADIERLRPYVRF